ncbi:hypothetical protein HN018_07510 [Lichenicola cladoniae]|jgi:hypothetical protein|uniref:Uncharacterized protein n=1 Tax=Lichenicola cladoniae TaxID=1484109 RepID=A0A6M8HNB0_9PROT|nr:hypothetical protein [Lichenicola cladoniae]NPD67422.1 hypothetical protein [Acetobacteraceae bacterium]QKE89913.1 hypothetical protein HN018_07510 [Lichenicola cladoniae]
MHHGYGYQPGFGHHNFGGGGGWLTHMIISSVVHGLIYGAIFRLLRHLSLTEIVLLVVLVIGGIYLWNQNRYNRRW